MGSFLTPRSISAERKPEGHLAQTANCEGLPLVPATALNCSLSCTSTPHPLVSLTKPVPFPVLPHLTNYSCGKGSHQTTPCQSQNLKLTFRSLKISFCFDSPKAKNSYRYIMCSLKCTYACIPMSAVIFIKYVIVIKYRTHTDI